MIYRPQKKLPKKYSESCHAYSEATFDYSTTEPSQKNVGLSSLLDILLWNNFQQISKVTDAA